jgi:hypothetical protein
MEHMINSLLTDSHITPSFCISEKQHDLGRSAKKHERQKYSNAVLSNNVNTSIQKEPAKISFSGLLDSKEIFKNFEKQTIKMPDMLKLIIDEKSPFSKIVENAKKLLNEDGEIENPQNLYKKTAKLMNNAVDTIINPEAETDEITQRFLSSSENKNDIEKLIEYSKELSIPEEKNLTEEEFEKQLHNNRKELINDSNDVLALLEKNNKKDIYLNSTVKKYLKKAEDVPMILNALFSLLLTGICRPASIMVLPGQKKNKDDKKYAAAHSIASGIIGYITSSIIFAPIGSAIKAVGKNPDKYLGEKSLGFYLEDKGLSYIHKVKAEIVKENLSEELTQEKISEAINNRLKGSNKFTTTKRFINMFPDVVLAAPKAILTIALIPPILKYVFGWEKKKEKETNNIQDTNKTGSSLNIMEGKKL